MLFWQYELVFLQMLCPMFIFFKQQNKKRERNKHAVPNLHLLSNDNLPLKLPQVSYRRGR